MVFVAHIVDWMSELKRVQGFVPEHIYEYLEARSKKEKRRLGNLVGYLLIEKVEAEMAREAEANSSEPLKWDENGTM